MNITYIDYIYAIFILLTAGSRSRKKKNSLKYYMLYNIYVHWKIVSRLVLIRISQNVKHNLWTMSRKTILKLCCINFKYIFYRTAKRRMPSICGGRKTSWSHQTRCFKTSVSLSQFVYYFWTRSIWGLHFLNYFFKYIYSETKWYWDLFRESLWIFSK